MDEIQTIEDYYRSSSFSRDYKNIPYKYIANEIKSFSETFKTIELIIKDNKDNAAVVNKCEQFQSEMKIIFDYLTEKLKNIPM